MRAARAVMAVVGLVGCVACAGQSSQPQATATLQLTTREVVMDIVVLDAKGHSVQGLSASDFRVVEDGAPQTIRNVRVRHKTPFAEIQAVQAGIAAAERELAGNGRVVVRYSGTEALARVMIEAESTEQMDRLAESIVAAIRSALGA